MSHCIHVLTVSPFAIAILHVVLLRTTYYGEIPTGSALRRRRMQGNMKLNDTRYRAIVTVDRQQELLCDLPNGATSNSRTLRERKPPPRLKSRWGIVFHGRKHILGPSFSCPAISCPAILMVRHFHVRHFQSTHAF